MRFTARSSLSSIRGLWHYDNTREYIAQVSDQHGTCLVEGPGGWPVYATTAPSLIMRITCPWEYVHSIPYPVGRSMGYPVGHTSHACGEPFIPWDPIHPVGCPI